MARYQNIAANSTVAVSGGVGTLLRVVINKIGASSNTLILYDNTAASGDIIATIDTTIAGAPTREYDVTFRTGLTAVMGTGTAADVTVVTG